MKVLESFFFYFSQIQKEESPQLATWFSRNIVGNQEGDRPSQGSSLNKEFHSETQILVYPSLVFKNFYAQNNKTTFWTILTKLCGLRTRAERLCLEEKPKPLCLKKNHRPLSVLGPGTSRSQWH